MPENLTSDHLQAASPAARALALAELELAEAARLASDFARGLVPNGHDAPFEPGELVLDALELVDHARRVLAVTRQYERAHGTDIVGVVDAACSGLAVDLTTAASPVSDVLSDPVAERLFELDAWGCRHAEADDPIASVQPVTDAAARHLTHAVREAARPSKPAGGYVRGVETMFDGDIFVSYGQMTIENPTAWDVDYDLDRSFAGQVNGLCGAGMPKRLWFLTGLHTGWVRLTVCWPPLRVTTKSTVRRH